MSAAAKPSVLAPFRVRSFRFQWPADLATSWAQEMEGVILGWYILVDTGSVVLLTLFALSNLWMARKKLMAMMGVVRPQTT